MEAVRTAITLFTLTAAICILNQGVAAQMPQSDTRDPDFTLDNSGSDSDSSDGGVHLTEKPWWRPDYDNQSYCVAWGDYDRDGDQDLAVGNNGPNYIYENVDGNLSTVPVWASEDTADTELTQEMMWGDIDDDGWIDLVAANGAWGAGYDVVYLNYRGNISTEANWTNDNSDQSNGMDLGDWDGDGDLDLATANYNNRECVYENVDGTLSTSPVWQSYLYDDGTMDVNFFDVDDDDDLDLYVASSATMDSTDSNANRMYINDPDIWGDSRYGLLPDWTANDELWSTCSKVADIDGDGDLDVIVANGFNSNNLVVMYENTGTTLDRDYTWSVDIVWPVACDLGDVDGDGWIDIGISTYNAGDPNHVVLNDNGTLDNEPSWNSSNEQGSRRCEFGDMNGDGLLEFAVANNGGASADKREVVYLNDVAPPWVTIESPEDGEVVNGTVTVDGLAGTETNGTVRVEMSIDNGTWDNATGDELWTYDWDTWTVDNGNHTISARSLLGNRSSRTVSITVRVDNVNHDPTAMILEPDGENDTVDREFTIEWNVTDEDGDDLDIRLYQALNGDHANREMLDENLSNSGEFEWDTTYVDEGDYEISIIVEDGRGGEANTTAGPVTVDHPPSISVTTPPEEGAEADEEYTIEWTTWNASGDALIDIYYDDDTDSSKVVDVVDDDLGDSGEYLWDLSGIDEGEYYLYIYLTDGNYNSSEYSEGTLTVDHAGGTEPKNHKPTVVIHDPASQKNNTADETFTITWTADDEDGDEVSIRLEYDEDDQVGAGVNITHDWVMAEPGEWDWDTTDVPEGEYYIYAIVDDANGSQAQTFSNGTVTVVHPEPGENTAPTITIETPADGSNQNDTIWINGTAHDADGNDDIDRVSIKIGSRNWRTLEGSTDWSYLWDTTKEGNGEITITVEVEDSEGATGTDEITVNVDNFIPGPPWIEISKPTDGDTVSGSVTIKGTAGGDAELKRVTVSVDGEENASMGFDPWEVVWDSSHVLYESVMITATVEDVDGRTNLTSINVTVNNNPPVVNQDPTITINTGSGSLRKGRTAVIEITVDDPDGLNDITSVFADLRDLEGKTVLTIPDTELSWLTGTVYISIDTRGFEIGGYILYVFVVDSSQDGDFDTWSFEVVKEKDEGKEDRNELIYTMVFFGAAITVLLMVAMSHGKKRGKQTVAEVQQSDVVPGVQYVQPSPSAEYVPPSTGEPIDVEVYEVIE